jgi:hypothetical protein
MPSVTSQYSESSQRDLASASPPPPPPNATSSYQNLPRGAAIAAASYVADAASSRHSLDRLSATPPPPPLPKRGEGPVLAGAAAEGRFDGHFTKYLKQQQQQQQQQQCYEEPQLARLGSPLRDNFVERMMGEPATALSPASIPLDLSKKKQPESSFRFVFYLPCVLWTFVIRNIPIKS